MTVRRYRIALGGKTYDVEVGDTITSPVAVVVNGVTYQIELPGRPQQSVRTGMAQSTIPPRPSVLAAAPRPAAAAPTVPAGPTVPATTAPVAGGAHAVTAQMPGKVVSVAAKPGDELRRGQPICVIESMKMELTIAAPRDCKVAAVRVAPGEAVRNGQVLAEIE
jgi:3-methylcrotonyl-CoA carboxylase alpha subunit